MGRGGGGVWIPPKSDDVILNEQPLNIDRRIILPYVDRQMIFQYADNNSICRSADNIAICSTAPDNENVVQLRVFKSFATLSKAPRAIT